MITHCSFIGLFLGLKQVRQGLRVAQNLVKKLNIVRDFRLKNKKSRYLIVFFIAYYTENSETNDFLFKNKKKNF